MKKLIVVVVTLMLSGPVLAETYYCDSSIRARTLNKTWAECPRHRWPPYDRALYVGGFSDGKFWGKGTYTWVNGNVYIGRWKDGKMHGRGTLTFANGDKHVGIWVHGQLRFGTVYD
jgi:hypothetical protein